MIRDKKNAPRMTVVRIPRILGTLRQSHLKQRGTRIGVILVYGYKLHYARTLYNSCLLALHRKFHPIAP